MRSIKPFSMPPRSSKYHSFVGYSFFIQEATHNTHVQVCRFTNPGDVIIVWSTDGILPNIKENFADVYWSSTSSTRKGDCVPNNNLDIRQYFCQISQQGVYSLFSSCADAKIEQLLGSKDIWLMSNYIQQGHRNRFLVASENDKLGLLSSLTFLHESPSKTHIAIRQAIDLAKTTLYRQEGYLKAVEVHQSKTGGQKSMASYILDEKTAASYQEKLTSLQESYEIALEKSKQQAYLKQRIDSLEKQLCSLSLDPCPVEPFPMKRLPDLDQVIGLPGTVCHSGFPHKTLDG